MNNTAKTNNDIVYLNYRYSGIAPANSDTTVAPTAISNITKGRTMIIQPPPATSKPISNEK